jgi:hypothetical protein
MATDHSPTTTRCPECGDAEFHRGLWYEGNHERICASCQQSWFADVDYSKTDPHPWYAGGCDALGADGTCAECAKLAISANQTTRRAKLAVETKAARQPAPAG